MMKRNPVLPPTYLLMALLAMVALHLLLPVLQIIASPWNLLGLLPLILGIAINVIADNLFHQVKTTVRPFEESSVLVTSGPFRWSRNPMYLGFVLILTGIGILLGSLTPFAIVLAFAVLIDRRFIQVEEHMLAAEFGAVWQAYIERTRRWL